MNKEKTYHAIISRGKQRIKSKGLHQHRIVPGFEGGTYCDENISYLTLKEHRIVHKLRYLLYGHWQDLKASRFLGNKLTESQWILVRTEAARAGGYAKAKLKLPPGNKGRRGHYHDPECVKQKKRLSQTGMKFWNNGQRETRTKVNPGPGWIRGRLRRVGELDSSF